MWADTNEMEREQKKAWFLLVLFVFCTINLFVSIIMTIITPPGYIPEDTEWDMPIEGSEDDAQSSNSQNEPVRQSEVVRDSNLSGVLIKHNKKADKAEKH